MFMQHRVVKKGQSAVSMAGSAENIMNRKGLSVVARGDTWRLGSTASVLVLTQTLALPDGGSWVVTVAVSEDANAVGVVDAVNQDIIGTQGL